jgi:PAS domain S-box-containing protein
MAFNIRTKLMLLGLGCIFATSLALVFVGIWQGSVLSNKASQEAAKLVDADLDHITASIYNLINAQDRAIQLTANHDLNVARNIFKQSGPISQSDQTVEWLAVNQSTKEVATIELPRLMVGGRWLGQTKPMWDYVPVVDEVMRLVGETCTIFQRINPQGDLLRVATNVEIKNGIRAIGTFIPAIDPDGQPNPVVSTLMKGDTYRGLSYAVNAWHIAAYEPFYDDNLQMIGALHVGININSIDSLRDAILQLKIGKSGYVFILGGKGDDRGHYIISKDGQRDGENLWNRTDADGHLFVQSIINKALACRPGEFATERYPWINPGESQARSKIARLAYYEPWDWVIGASVYEDEISESTAIFTKGYQSMIRVFGWVAIGVAILGGIVTYCFARSISNSLGVVTRAATNLTEKDLPRLVQTMDAVIDGDLSVTFQFDKVPVEVHSTDELGLLANAFTSMNMALVNVGMAFTSMMANLRDLTGQLEQRVAERTAKLKESERMRGNIIDFLPDATLVIDKQGNVLAWNHAIVEMTGIQSEDILGQGNYAYAVPFYGERQPILIDLVLNPDRANEAKYGAFKRVDNTLFAETCSSRLPKKGTVYILAAASALYDAHGEVIGAIETLRDISEWKLIETELIQARCTAEEATQSKSEFLANMSHEIRTPMNGVMGMTSLLLDTELSSDQREYAQTAQNSADALLTIINDILDFSKIEAGKLDFENLDFDLRHTLDEIAELVSLKSDEKGIEFASYVHPDVPSLLKGDPGRIRQILLNLATNAIKFTQAGDVVIEASLVKDHGHCVELHFDVKDSGIGIPKNRLNLLFKSFSQVDSSTTRKFGGTGLGLAISKRLVEMMGGRIGVESQEGQGATFWFTVHLDKQPASNREAFKLKLPEDIQGKRILAVDDNETNRKIMRAYLRSWKCHTTVVDSGPQALAMLTLAAENGMPFDMAIADYMMPEMDGETLGRAIKANPNLKDIRLVLLTSRGMRGDAARAHSAGFDAYLTKPIKQSQLFNAMVTVFGKPAAVSGAAQEPIVTRHSLAETVKHKLSILLAEDNPVNQKVALLHLRKFGYGADVAGNGREALEAVKKNTYDLILMDVQMPEMDGYGATRAIRAAGYKLPIIAMTANAMKGDREKCLEAGMDDYITKPVNPTKLLETIKKWSCTDSQDGQSNYPIA